MKHSLFHFRHFIILPVLFLAMNLLYGCGFQPLFKTTDNANHSETSTITSSLASIEIDSISGAEGIRLRNLLIQKLAPRGRNSTLYHLQTDLRHYSSGSGLVENSETQRRIMNVVARFKLITNETGEVREFTLSANAGYSIGTSLYATDVAGEDSLRKLLEVIASDAFNQLSLILAPQSS